mmetsp:Transcript_1577/g.3438  ORF Transcript_1577/g.3438 Transcript_1577/m.3438 type:complete len:260 (-) Transcript_1577:915-1694(-)
MDSRLSRSIAGRSEQDAAANYQQKHDANVAVVVRSCARGRCSGAHAESHSGGKPIRCVRRQWRQQQQRRSSRTPGSSAISSNSQRSIRRQRCRSHNARCIRATTKSTTATTTANYHTARRGRLLERYGIRQRSSSRRQCHPHLQQQRRQRSLRLHRRRRTLAVQPPKRRSTRHPRRTRPARRRRILQGARHHAHARRHLLLREGTPLDAVQDGVRFLRRGHRRTSGDILHHRRERGGHGGDRVGTRVAQGERSGGATDG